MNPMNPAGWPRDILDEYQEEGRIGRRSDPYTGDSDNALVIGSTTPVAQYVAQQTIKAGGNAVDAAIAMSLAQVTCSAGAWVSFAGIATMVIRDPKTGAFHSINGPYKTFRNETDPMSIPHEEPSGRTALVPGYFAALDAAHKQFGKLDWADLFLPSIWLAREGVAITSDVHMAAINMRRDVLKRLPETSDIYFPGGEDPWRPDGWFKQPALAETLSRVADEGIDYIYKGDWADAFVAQVSADGGKVTKEDLESYEPVCSPAIHARAYGYDLYGTALPDDGGVHLMEAVRLAEALELGDTEIDGEALYWLNEIVQQTFAHRVMPDKASRLTDEHRDYVAEKMRDAGGRIAPSQIISGTHSDYVVTADAEGYVVSMCHSINSVMWGGTGLNVGGISIPDSAGIQKIEVARVVPGDYLPNPMNPLIAAKDGDWVLASSSIGGGLMMTTVQCLHAALGLGVDVTDIGNRTLVHGMDMGNGDTVVSGGGEGGDDQANADRIAQLTQQAFMNAKNQLDIEHEFMKYFPSSIEDSVDPAVLAKATEMGGKFAPVPRSNPEMPRGFWVGLAKDPATGKLKGVKTAGAAGLILSA